MKKQAVIALSSMEAKYISQTHAAKEAVWLRNFVVELQGKTQGVKLRDYLILSGQKRCGAEIWIGKYKVRVRYL